ncbi:MAG: hypothetical protein JXJ04_06215 [Spirochaetales bacterium]|nr:hypothetical protein [Spirochaetales bacterium]
MEKIIEIKTVIKNLNILTIVLKKFNFVFTTPKKKEIPQSLGDPSLVSGLIRDPLGVPVCYVLKDGKWFTLFPHQYDEGKDIGRIISKIKQEYARTEILKIALQNGWNRLSQRKQGDLCQIILSV